MAKFRVHPNEETEVFKKIITMVNRVAYDSTKNERKRERDNDENEGGKTSKKTRESESGIEL